MELTCEHHAAKLRPHSEYRLPDIDRLEILAETPLAIQSREIERQRQAFIAQHGDQFGTE